MTRAAGRMAVSLAAMDRPRGLPHSGTSLSLLTNFQISVVPRRPLAQEADSATYSLLRTDTNVTPGRGSGGGLWFGHLH